MARERDVSIESAGTLYAPVFDENRSPSAEPHVSFSESMPSRPSSGDELCILPPMRSMQPPRLPMIPMEPSPFIARLQTPSAHLPHVPSIRPVLDLAHSTPPGAGSSVDSSNHDSSFREGAQSMFLTSISASSSPTVHRSRTPSKSRGSFSSLLSAAQAVRQKEATNTGNDGAYSPAPLAPAGGGPLALDDLLCPSTINAPSAGIPSANGNQNSAITSAIGAPNAPQKRGRGRPRKKPFGPQPKPEPKAHSPQYRTSGSCWTCKLRRKKCDEGKPGCSICASLGVPCLGYDKERPDYMTNPRKNQEMRSRIARIVQAKKGGSRSISPLDLPSL